MSYSKVNIDELDDQAAGYGLQSGEARFPRQALGAERIGLAHYQVKPDQRLEFGHRHRSMEEAYVVLAGSGTFRVDDETFEVKARDVVRVEPTSWRGWEAGPDGMEMLALGEHKEGDGESEMDMEWWPKG
ncbi:MAG TPA: cupin domain-containing protein [Solirubrobacteraceae bacterium]|jgi:quercetin dioxygenase-like cupin family protein